MKNNTKQSTQTANGIIGEDDYELIDINYLVTGGRDDFLAFEVTGDSMSPTIQTGDIVFIDTLAEIRPGDVIVAVVSGLNCIKISEKAKDRLYLVSGNSNYEPREITDDSFYVVGKVKGYLSILDEGSEAKRRETKPNKPESAPETADNVHHTRFSA